MDTSSLRIVSLFFLAICLGLYFYTDQQKDHYDQDSKPQIEKILTDISRWEKQPLLTHLSADAKQTMTDQQLEQLLAHYRKFGQLERIDTLNFSRLASALSLLGQTRINYEGGAQFSQSSARINITLTIEDGHYKIYNLTITET